MRNFILGLVTTAFVVMGAGSALAVSANFIIDASTTGTVDGNSIDAVVGDSITLLISVDNSEGDAIQSLFTTISFDASVLELAGGGNLGNVLQEPGFGGPSLGVIAQPQQKFGEPAGNIIGLAFASTGAPTSATGPEVTTQLVFSVIGAGSTDITHLVGNGDESLINGDVGAPSFGPAVSVTVVPEPGTALLMGLGLAGLAAAGRRE